MNWEQGDVPVVLAGGVFANNEMIVPRLQQLALANHLPLRFMLPVLEPIGGAVVGAFKMAHVQLEMSFIETFQTNFAKMGY